MNCKQCQKRLHDYLDETLEADARAEVGEHLAACEACRRELDALRKVAALVGSLDEVPEPSGFLVGVRARIDRPSAWERVRQLLTQPLRPGYSVAIPVLIVAFFAVFVVMNLPPKTPELAEKPTADSPEAAPTEIAYDMEKTTWHEEKAGEYGYFKPSDEDGSKAKDYTNDTKVRKRLDTDHGSKLDDIEGTDTDETGSSLGGSFRGGATQDTVSKGGEGGGLEDESVDAEVAQPEIEEGEQLARRESGESLRVKGELKAGDDTYALETDTRGEADEDKASLAEIESRPGEKLADVAGADREPDATRDLNIPTVTPAGPRGVTKSQPPKAEEVIELAVVDFPRDRTNVERIVAEEAGRVFEVRAGSNKLLDGLVLEVPEKNYDNAVRRLYFYNDANVKVLQEQKQQLQGKTRSESGRVSAGRSGTQQNVWNSPFRLFVRRIVQKTTATGAATDKRQNE